MTKRDSWPKTEEELCLILAEWLEEMGWDVYAEVDFGRNHGVVDIAATLEGKWLWLFEAKKHLNLKVIQQAMQWRGYGHYVSVAVPARVFSARGKKTVAQTGAEILRKFDIGLVTVPNPAGGIPPREHVKAKLRRNAASNAKRMISYLSDFHKLNVPGSKGKRWTHFKYTVQQLTRLVESNPGIPMKEAIKQLQHHYKTDQSAIHALSRYIDRGVITTIMKNHDGSKLRLYPINAEHVITI